MFINDDGLQIIDEDERRARIEFYADHSIGWTARPKHGLNGFVRKGKFKKVCSLYKVFWDSASVTHFSTLYRPAQPMGTFPSLLVASFVDFSCFWQLWRCWSARAIQSFCT